MKIHRFVVKDIDLASLALGKNIPINDNKVIWQIRRVLRLKIDHQVKFLDGIKTEILGRIKQLDKEELIVEVENIQEFIPKREIIVGLPVIKFNRLEWAVEKLSELGITDIIPVYMENSSFSDSNSDFSNKIKRWQDIAKEAIEQSEGFKIPQITSPLKLVSLIDLYKDSQPDLLKIMLNTDTKIPNMVNSLYNLNLDKYSKYIILAGCEGGFTNNEVKMAQDNGFIQMNLGKTILRVETALICATAILKNFSEF